MISMPYPIEDAVPQEAVSARFGATATEDRVPYGPPPDRPLADAPAREPQIPRHKGLWLILASATALVVLAPTGAQLYGWMFQQSTESTWSEAHPISSVRVDATSGDVQIGPGAAGQARVRESLHWVLHRPSVQETWDGDNLVVTVACDGGGGSLLPNQCSADLDITVPASVPVTVTSRSGGVSVGGMNGSIQAETDSGDIQLTGDSGAITAHAISGSVAGRGLTGTEANVQVESGDIELDYVTAPQRVVSRVVSGDTLILVPRGGGYIVSGQSISGGRDIDQTLTNNESSHVISADSVSGDVAVRSQD